MVMLVSIPSVSPAVPVRTPVSLPRPRRLLRNVLSLVTKNCDATVLSSFPIRTCPACLIQTGESFSTVN